MTVTNTNLRNDYTGNGSTTVYAFTFTAIYEVGSAKYSLKVITTDTDGVETLKTQGTDYTVALAANGTGTITFATAPVSGHKISILIDMSFTQETDYIKSGSDKFPAESHEKALDKLTLIAKQFYEMLQRSILIPESSLLSGIVLPVTVPNAGKAIIVNDAGDDLDVKNLTDISAITISDFGESLVNDEDASEARTTLGLEIGTDVQPYNANLQALADLVGSANKIPYFTGAGAMSLADLSSNKNVMINGDLNIWQRGTSFTNLVNGQYTADRYVYFKTGSMVHDITRSSDVPTVAQAGRKFNYSLKIDCTTIDNSLAAGDACIIQQRVEGYNWLPLAQKIVTRSFWFKATKVGIYCASLGNGGNDRSCVKEFTVNASDTWEYKTVTFPASPSAGIWDYSNGVGARLSICLASGTEYQATPDSYQNGNFFATANQVNACDNTSNNVFICGDQLEVGSIATPFESRTIQEEFELCTNYAELLQSNSIANSIFGYGQAVANSRINVGVKFKKKRATPTISTSAASTFGLRQGITTIQGSVINDSSWQASTSIVNLDISGASTPFTQGGGGYIDAYNTTNAFILADAEL